jgi:dTDP-4-amino-4,6-dideoxygalactose transaminase
LNELGNHPLYLKSRHFAQLCHDWFNKYYPGGVTLLTNSCTQSLELAAILLDIQPGDEVIMPSFTYVSTANAFALRGGVPVFVDIKPTDLNIDENLIEAAITPKTKAIVVVHYGAVACNMERIMEIANKNQMPVVEDNAHGIMASYNGKRLGSFGQISCISFDFLKNINCGEGGSITVNDPEMVKRLELVYENGTDRLELVRGQVPFYSWKDLGSNFYPSELIATFLYAQLQQAETIIDKRISDWNLYYRLLKPLADEGQFELAQIQNGSQHNGHIFFIKLQDSTQRQDLIQYLKNQNIDTAWHYIPLHTSEYGLKVSRFHGEDRYTTRESERMLRLPIFYKITPAQIERVCEAIKSYFSLKPTKVLIGTGKQ